MTDVVQENKQDGVLKGLLDKFIDRLPAMDDNKASLLFISVLTCATLGTLGGMQKHELGWIVFFTFLSGIFAGVGIPLLRAYLAMKKAEKVTRVNLPDSAKAADPRTAP